MRLLSWKTLTLVTCSAVGGCNDDNATPVARSAEFSALEDQSVTGQLIATDPEREPLVYAVVSARNGSVTSLNSSNGAFVFEPSADFYGTAGFTFSVTDGHGNKASAAVTCAFRPRRTLIPTMADTVGA